MDIDSIHIGNIIKEKWVEKAMTVTEFSTHLHLSRTAAYAIFKRKSIDINLLIKISEVLDYDFIRHVYLPEMLQKVQIVVELNGTEATTTVKNFDENVK